MEHAADRINSVGAAKVRSRINSIIAALRSDFGSKLEENPWNRHQGYRDEAEERSSPGYAETLVHYSRNALDSSLFHSCGESWTRLNHVLCSAKRGNAAPRM